MKNLFKSFAAGIIGAVVATMITASASSPLVVYQGGTGLSAISNGQFITGSGGQVMTAVSTNDLSWDNTNKRLGVGTAAPADALHIFSAANGASFIRSQNTSNGSSAQVGVAVQSDTAGADYKAHASAWTISRWGVTLGGWVEFLGTIGNGVAIGTQGAAPLILGANSANRIHITSDGNIGINTALQFGAGVKVIAIANATTLPTTNPSGGGVIFVDQGALKYRGSSGTVTTIANP